MSPYQTPPSGPGNTPQNSQISRPNSQLPQDFLHTHFPSLNTALNRLQYHHQDAGYLLGALTELASYFTSAIHRGASNTSLYPDISDARIYLETHGFNHLHSRRHVPGLEAAEDISVDELVALLRSLCSDDTVPTDLHPPGTDRAAYLQYAAEDVECRFVMLLRDVVTEVLMQGVQHHQWNDHVEEGWQMAWDNIRRDHPFDAFDASSPPSAYPSAPASPSAYSTTYTSSFSTLPESACPIGLGRFTKKQISQGRIVTTNCGSRPGHVFHGECLREWIEALGKGNVKTCPMCREILRPCREGNKVDTEDEDEGSETMELEAETDDDDDDQEEGSIDESDDGWDFGYRH